MRNNFDTRLSDTLRLVILAIIIMGIAAYVGYSILGDRPAREVEEGQSLKVERPQSTEG